MSKYYEYKRLGKFEGVVLKVWWEFIGWIGKIIVFFGGRFMIWT